MTLHDDLHREARRLLVDADVEARAVVRASIREKGEPFTHITHRGVARRFRDAADAYLVAIDAALEAGVDEDQLLRIYGEANQTIWSAFIWNHDVVEGSGWAFTGVRYEIGDTEAARLLRDAGATVLVAPKPTRASRRPDEFEFEVELSDGRVVVMPSYELPVRVDGVFAMLGRTEIRWSDTVSRFGLDPTPRWYVRRMADHERRY